MVVVKTCWRKSDLTEFNQRLKDEHEWPQYDEGVWHAFRHCDCLYAFGKENGRIYLNVNDCHIREGAVDLPNLLDAIGVNETPQAEPEPMDTWTIGQDSEQIPSGEGVIEREQ